MQRVVDEIFAEDAGGMNRCRGRRVKNAIVNATDWLLNKAFVLQRDFYA